MAWSESVFWWLAYSALLSLVVLALGSGAALLCRQPVRRLRIIELSLAACLLAPLLGMIPGYPHLGIAWPVPRNPASVDNPPVAPQSDSCAIFSEADDLRTTDHATIFGEISQQPMLRAGVPRDSIVPYDTAVDPPARSAQLSDTPVSDGLVGLYLLGVGAGVAWWLFGLVALGRIVWTAKEAPPHCRELLAEIAGPSSARVRLLTSRLAKQPFASVGVSMQPASRRLAGRGAVIVLPESLCDDDRAVRWALAHEWTHIENRDFRAWFLAGLVRVLFFYQPAVWWLRSQLRLCQDYVADGRAGRQTAAPEDYAEFLTARASAGLLHPALVGLGMGFSKRKSELYRRIVMLVQNRPLENRAPRVWTALVSAAALIAIGVLPAFSLKPEAAAQEDAPTATSSQQGGHISSSDAPLAIDAVDTTYMIEKALGVVVMRPTAGFARPEMAELARLCERTGNVVPKGTRMADFRQITAFYPAEPIPSGPCEILVLQWEKPVAKEYFDRQLVASKGNIKEKNGKKICVPPGGGRIVMLCDDHTVVAAGSEQAMDVYLAGNLGVLPKWLPAKTWESFRRDHFVMAADASLMRRGIKALMDRPSPVTRAALMPLSSVCAETTGLAWGMRLDHAFAVHGWAGGKNADAAENVLHTAEALKTLAGSVVKGYQTPSEIDRSAQPKAISALLAEADRLLHNITSHKDGNDVQLHTSVELDKSRLGALASAIVEATRPADPSTKSGIMALVEDFFRHNYRDITSRNPIEWGQPEETKDGNFSIRYKYSASYWGGEPKIVNQIFTFNRLGTFVSVKDAEKHAPPPPAKIYKVDKKVSDFPEQEDFSTPEAAYASITRAYIAEGTAAFPRLSVPWMAARMKGGVKRPLPKEAAALLLDSEILEVHLWSEDHAMVLARVASGNSGQNRIDMRHLRRISDRWLNAGNDSRPTLEEARQKIERMRSR